MPHATVRDGTSIYYESHGDESLPTLVLIRGTGADGTRWLPQVRAYKPEVRCVIFDGRGVGRSETTPPPYTVESMARDTFDLMDALGVQAAHLSGSSLGGAIALRMAADIPDRVLSLQLHSSWLGTAGFSEFSLGLLKAHLVSGGVEHYYAATLPMLISPSFMSGNFEMLMGILDHMRANAASYDGLLGQIQANLSYDMRAEAHKVSAPALVTVGEMDVVLPVQCSEEIHQALAGSDFHIFEGAGHLSGMERPDEFNRVTLEWLRRQLHLRRSPDGRSPDGS